MATMEGRVLLAQESRFQLMGRDGVAQHFILGHAAGADPEQLAALQMAQSRVRVGYSQPPDVHARVATRIDLLDA